MIRPQPPTSVERSVEASETAAVISGVDGTGAANTCTLGRTGPGGGIVFYVNPTDMPGRYYMETAPVVGVAEPVIPHGIGMVPCWLHPPTPVVAWTGSYHPSKIGTFFSER